MGTATAEAPTSPFGDVGGGFWAAPPEAYASIAGVSTLGRATLPSGPSLYDPPRASRSTRSTVRLGDPLSPSVSELMRPQGILQEKKNEIPAAHARYSKGGDTPSRGESEAHAGRRAYPSLFQSNSSMSAYAGTRARLRAPEPWHDAHPHAFKLASRRTRPSDRRDMVERRTLEEARTPLERRRVLELESARARADRRRVAAPRNAARFASSRRAAAAAAIKSAFVTRHEANEAFKNRAYGWKGDRGERASGYEPADDALGVTDALTRGARRKVPSPRVLGPCAFVPSSAEACAEARRAKTVTDERVAFADEVEALRATERRLGGAAPRAKYVASFADFARTHREAERIAGRAVRVHTRRGTALRREAESETQRQMRELDAFDTRLLRATV